ncbi:MAG: Uncharacterized inner membrane protein RarD, partial [uncultured Nocardioides sp.]
AGNASRARLRHRRLRPLGSLPPLLAAAGAGRRTGDPGPPHPVVGAHHGPARRRAAPGPPRRRAGARPPEAGAAGPGSGGHQPQLGDVHLEREQRPGGGGLARLLRQPLGDGAAGGARAGRAPAAAAVGRPRRRRAGGGRADPRLRPSAVDRARARVQLRHLRAAQEEGRRRRGGVARRRDGGLRALRRGVRRVPRGHGRLRLRQPRRGARAALHDHGDHHRCAADPVRRGDHAGAAGGARAAAVPRTGAAVRPGRAVVPRGDAPGPVGRLRARVAGAGPAHRRDAAPPPTAAAGRGGLRAGL